MSMYGAEASSLETAASQLRLAATELDESRGGLGGLLGALDWIGNVASAFVGLWSTDYKPRLGSTAGFLRDAATELERQAQQQRAASEAFGSWGRIDIGPFRGFPPGFEPRTSERFEGRGSARSDIVEAFYATADPGRAGSGEIEIRHLDNGNYVVVLPGVEDLSAHGGDALRALLAGQDPLSPYFQGLAPDTARLMRYAIPEAHDTNGTYDNPYARQVIRAMQDAGVPAGANVMFIGHSFGAFTAMELAGNKAFNAAAGSGSGYHVNVTHVVAAGADTNWKLPDVPVGTNALIINNRKDLVFRVEDGIQHDYRSPHPGQIEVEFNGPSNFHDAALKAGHDANIYARWLGASTDRPDVESWLNGAGTMYAGGGTRFSAGVPGPSPVDDVRSSLAPYA